MRFWLGVIGLVLGLAGLIYNIFFFDGERTLAFVHWTIMALAGIFLMVFEIRRRKGAD